MSIPTPHTTTMGCTTSSPSKATFPIPAFDANVMKVDASADFDCDASCVEVGESNPGEVLHLHMKGPAHLYVTTKGNGGVMVCVTSPEGDPPMKVVHEISHTDVTDVTRLTRKLSVTQPGYT